MHENRLDSRLRGNDTQEELKPLKIKENYEQQ